MLLRAGSEGGTQYGGSNRTPIHDRQTRRFGALGRTGTGIQTAAFYGAFAVIAAVVFGTLSVHPF